jgi:hypothetical protein
MAILRFAGIDVDGDNATCTIPQLLLILRELAMCADINDWIWFGADIIPDLAGTEGSTVKIGTIVDLQAWLQGLPVPQIEFGVFIAVAADKDGPGPWESFSAEGPEGRRYSESVFELLAFDTSHIEITTDREDVLRHLFARFPTAKLVSEQPSQKG